MSRAHAVPNVAPDDGDDDPTKVGPGSRRALKAWREVCALPVLFDHDEDLDDLEIGGEERSVPKSQTLVMPRTPVAPVLPSPAPHAPAPRRADIKPFLALAVGALLGALMPFATFFLLH